jgi:NADH-quinone oxidoreductase subunit G
VSAPTTPAADTVTLEVDGKPLRARKGAMLIEATDAAGIYIPRFCYHKKLSIAANCRMCLVEVEKAPKPLPACATPVADGMKVYTRSEKAREAQKGTMEFLLINHPLDCPICDQGGECELQDLALGYGKDASRYQEAKRIVKDKNLGPLIATEMTRCIHCTRCVRFGQEIAGIMELGATGRGEHMQIGTYIERSVDSELSGNVIDLCPVGALTAKPSRYTARPWELEGHASISPHDCVGTNIEMQVRRGRVLRVLPRENEEVNECWIADRDRFSYEAINADDRLKMPMIRRNGQWEETDWQTALEFTLTSLNRVLGRHGPEQLGALASPGATLEEHFLLQKLVRALGSNNVDHRLRQSDFTDDDAMPPFPYLGQSIADLERLRAVLLIGSNLRKDQPLLNHRVRKAVRKGAQAMVINPLDYDFNYRLAYKAVTPPAHLAATAARVALALAALKQADLPAEIRALAGDADAGAKAMAEVLFKSESAAVLLGNLANFHPQAATLRTIAQHIADLSGARFGHIPETNSAGAWLAGGVPHRGPAGVPLARSGQNAQAMLRDPLKAYLLFGVELELDCLNGAQARAAMKAAELVVMCTAFKPSIFRGGAVDYAHVLLPLAAFAETAGSFVNAEGRRQAFNGAVEPPGQARPGWKILRVLGSMMQLPGFTYTNIDEVRSEIGTDVTPSARLAVTRVVPPTENLVPMSRAQVTRIAEVPIYAVDALTRRAPSLQATADNPGPAAHLNAAQAAILGVSGGDQVLVRMAAGDAELELVIDPRVPDGCVWIPAGFVETVSLGGCGLATVQRAIASAEARA